MRPSRLAPSFTLAFPRASGLIVTQQHGSMNSRATINHGDAGRRRGNPGASVCVAERRLIVARRFLVRCGPRLGSAAASRRFWTRRSRKRGTSFKSADLSAHSKGAPAKLHGRNARKDFKAFSPGGAGRDVGGLVARPLRPDGDNPRITWRFNARFGPPPATRPEGPAEFQVQPWGGRPACRIARGRRGDEALDIPAPRPKSHFRPAATGPRAGQTDAEEGTGFAPPAKYAITINPFPSPISSARKNPRVSKVRIDTCTSRRIGDGHAVKSLRLAGQDRIVRADHLTTAHDPQADGCPLVRG